MLCEQYYLGAPELELRQMNGETHVRTDESSLACVCVCVCIKRWLLFPPCSQQGQRGHPDLLRPLSPVSHALWTLQGKILFPICQTCLTDHKTWRVLITALFFLCRTPWEQPSRPTSPAGRCRPLRSWLPSVERTCQSRWITGRLEMNFGKCRGELQEVQDTNKGEPKVWSDGLLCPSISYPE